MARDADEGLDYLLDMNDVRYVVDEQLGLWVGFKARQAKDREHGVRYALNLYNADNERIMGFDNAHPIEYGGNRCVAPKRSYDHWHRDEKDKGRPYHYEDAGKLMQDFWDAVDKKMKQLKRGK